MSDCIACNGTGEAYLWDGVYGTCYECGGGQDYDDQSYLYPSDEELLRFERDAMQTFNFSPKLLVELVYQLADGMDRSDEARVQDMIADVEDLTAFRISEIDKLLPKEQPQPIDEDDVY